MNKLKCMICGKTFSHLGSHIWHKHKITAREYKQEFELPYNMSLISDEVLEKKRAGFERNKDFFLNNLKKSGKKYQFKKGHTGQRRISEHEKVILLERIKQVNKNRKSEKCLICNMIYKNINSHYYTKHRDY